MKFRIIREDHNDRVKNYHIYLDIKDINKPAILEFIDYFRKNHAKGQANISIYNDEIVSSFCFLNKDLTKKQRDLLRKHWIGFSTFEVPLDVWMYPEI